MTRAKKECKTLEPSYDHVAQTDDPVELHILGELDKLRLQNIRLKTYVAKSGVWANLKEVTAWKPYDFYHYFCTLYRSKYRTEYHDVGNMVRSYHDIECFQQLNKIPNEQYRRFIDLAFSRHFNFIHHPVIGHLCNKELYEKLMGVAVEQTRQKDWNSLDGKLGREAQSSRMGKDPYAALDNRLAREACAAK